MVQPSGAIGADAVSTFWPWTLSAPCSGSTASGLPDIAACTCASFDMSVLRSTSEMSGWAISRPPEPTT